MMKTTEIAYLSSSAQLFAKIKDLNWAVLLDSCQPNAAQGRYDIMSALPYIQLQTNAKTTRIQNEQTISYSTQNPFQLIKKYLGEIEPQTSPLPFYGGAIGFFAYDLAHSISEQLTTLDENQKPDMCIGIYDWAIIQDHQLQKTFLVENDRSANTAQVVQQIKHLLNQPAPAVNSFRLNNQFDCNNDFNDYSQAYKKIKDYINAGDCYQVNLSQQLCANYSGDSWDAYTLLRKENPAPFSAFLNYPNFSVLSCSPEQFLQTNNRDVTSKPIKGTRKRIGDKNEDQRLAKELQTSSKDRAENLMIVDLVRNDISKNCEIGSIKVKNLFNVESFPGIHHLVSSVHGTLEKDKHPLDLFADCFPGGSITGAPKVRAMQIIEELEKHQRHVYCGSIGYFSYHGHSDSNIAIRTLVCEGQQIELHAGGAIVADSELEKEFQECFSKVAVIIKALQKR